MLNIYKAILAIALFECVVYLFYLNYTDLFNLLNQPSNSEFLEDVDNYINQLNRIGRLNDVKVFRKKCVLISVSIVEDKDYYYFQLPMIVKAWDRIGFKTVIILVVYESEDLSSNPLAMKTIQYLMKFNAKVHFLKTKENIILVSMLARLFGGVFDNLNDEDFIITSDSDLYPIDRKYYLNDTILSIEDSIFAWNAYCCGKFPFQNQYYTIYPIGHVGMRKKLWRSVFKLDVLDNASLNSKFIISQVKEFVNGSITIISDEEMKQRQKNTSNWDIDQKMVSIYIARSANKAKLFKIPHDCERLDRGSDFSKEDYDLKKYCDFHSFQNDIYEKIDLLLNIFKNLFDAKTYMDILKYQAEFLALKLSMNKTAEHIVKQITTILHHNLNGI